MKKVSTTKTASLMQTKVKSIVPLLEGMKTDPPPFFFAYFIYVLCADFSNILLIKFLIQPH